MDHAIYPVKQIKAAFDRAFELSADREAAMRAAAQSLGIAVEAVRGVVGEPAKEDACTS